jgi:ribonuclease BN (tRNA processing enzyme)
VLLDCGNGVFAKLRAQLDYLAVDAVVLTHLHADHFLDLVPFSYALAHGPRRDDDNPVRPALHAPPGARQVFRRVAGGWGSEELIENAFALHEYDAADTIEVGALRVRFTEVDHFVQAFAVEVTAPGGGRLVFGADTGPSDSLVAFAQGADLLMVEATLLEPEPDGDRGHLTAREAGEHAARAGVGALVLTHITDELDESAARRAAAATFGKDVSIAREGAVYVI